MLASMSDELQRQNEDQLYAYDIHQRLQKLYAEKVREQRYAITKELFRCHMVEGSPVQDHGLKMMALIERLSSLGVTAPNELFTDLILQSLPPSFDSFVVNYSMHLIKKGPSKLVNVLRVAEATMKRDKPVMLVGSFSGSKAAKPKRKKKKGKGSPNPDQKGKGSLTVDQLKAKGGVIKKRSQANDKCHYCDKSGH